MMMLLAVLQRLVHFTALILSQPRLISRTSELQRANLSILQAWS